MGPIIILDKSTLEALSPGEVFILHKYYHVNIAPVLALEILGDLKKPRENQSSESRVVQLANKIMAFDAVVNVHYKSQIKASLAGYEVKMDRRPVLSDGRTVKNENGEQGIVFEVSAAEKAFLRWKNSDFSEAEKILGGLWRESTRSLDIEGLIIDLKKVSPHLPSFKDTKHLFETLTALLARREHQVHFLMAMVNEFGLASDIDFVQKVLLRWEAGKFENLEPFAPYAFYCFKVNYFFQLGLINNFFGTKSTNRVDLEYVYYLPFCMAFSSGDKFLKQIAPYFIHHDQSFIDKNQLKEDLKKIELTWHSANDKQQWDTVPPEDPDSITWQIWKKHMSTDRRNRNFALNLTKEQNQKLADFIFNKLKGEVDLPHSTLNSDDVDFVIKKRTITKNDYCVCGSGLRFGDCHGKDLK